MSSFGSRSQTIGVTGKVDRPSDEDLDQLAERVCDLALRKLMKRLAKIAGDPEEAAIDYTPPVSAANARPPFRKLTIPKDPKKIVKPTAEDYAFAAKWNRERKHR